MKCPHCDYMEDRVIDSRVIRDGRAIRRRRVCDKCNKRFTTYEYIEAVPLQVIKRDGRRESYQRDKLAAGIRKALHKRPVSAQAMEDLVDRIEAELSRLGTMEVEVRTIGERVMAELALLDQVAYVRFASVYRHFQDVQQFVETIQSLPPGVGDRVAEGPPTEAEKSAGQGKKDSSKTDKTERTQSE
jgi:transcriptional repressor NrdR